ncbi:MAG: galactosyltransferase-related protein [Thermodesulfobacteriota bacterium]|nr:galactosyltransferase-related protein [Thermodesulfobacteriota bacterium]
MPAAQLIDLGIVVPAYRLPNQSALEKRFSDSVQSDAAPKISWKILFVTPDRFDIVTRADDRDVFNIGKAYNAGINYFRHTARFIACADIDLLFPPGFLDYSVEMAARRPFCAKVRLVDPDEIESRNWGHWQRRPSRPGSGAWNVMRYAEYDAIGGFNEALFGWGGIDTDFRQRKNRLYGKDGVFFDDRHPLMHVNHEPHIDNAPRRPSENMKIVNAFYHRRINWLQAHRGNDNDHTPPHAVCPYQFDPGRYRFTYPAVDPPNMPPPEPDYQPVEKLLPADPVPLLAPDDPVIILTVLRSGWIDYNEKEFGPRYLAAMADMLCRHVTRPYELWCITDMVKAVKISNPEIRTFPLARADFAKKYCKLELFRPDVHAAAAGRRIVTIDLDTLIIGNIDDLLGYAGAFAMLRHPNTAHYGMSGLMSFPARSVTHLYDTFSARPDYYKIHYPLYKGRGDQLFINRHLVVLPHVWEDIWPDAIMDFRDVPEDGPPPETRIVYFWGKETPDKNLHIPWVADAWLSQKKAQNAR